MELTNELREQILEDIRNGAKTDQHRVHIVPVEGLWLISSQRTRKVERQVSTLEEALSVAKSVTGTRLIVIHNREGGVAQKIEVA